MLPDTIGQISALVVTLSAIPYMVRVYQRKIEAKLVSWGIWSLLGLAILITYSASGATGNVWPAVAGFINPVLITGLAYWKGERKKPEPIGIMCAAIGIASIILWAVLTQSPSLMWLALCVAILADACAAIPTIRFIFKNPLADRPLAWSLYSVGYGIGCFAITEHTFANWVLPAWMVLGSSAVALPMIIYRIRNRVSLANWV